MKKILLLIIFIFFIRENVYSQQVSYNDTLDAAMQNSFDLKITQLDIGISTQKIKGARADYFPKISAYSTTEYTKNLLNYPTPVAYIGNEVLLNDSQYQSSLSLGLTYNLFDFGIRKSKLEIAKKDKQSQEIEYIKELRDLKLNLSQTYAKALYAYKELHNKQEILVARTELFQMQKRLNEAGKIPKTESLSEEIKLSASESERDKAASDYAKSLEELAFLTQTKYEADKTELNDFDINDIVFVNNTVNLKAEKSTILEIEDTPEYKFYKSEIEKKQKELDIKKKENLPQFNFQSNYYFYGTDPNSLANSYDNLSQRGIKFRLVGSLPIFDGFKNKSERESLKLEIEKLKITKEQKLAELYKNYNQMQQDSIYSKMQLKNTYKTLELVNSNIEMLDRLDKNKLIDKVAYLNSKIELLNKRLELEQAQISDYLATYKLDVLTDNN